MYLYLKEKVHFYGFIKVILFTNTKQEAMTNIMAVFTYVDKDIWLQSG